MFALKVVHKRLMNSWPYDIIRNSWKNMKLKIKYFVVNFLYSILVMTAVIHTSSLYFPPHT